MLSSLRNIKKGFSLVEMMISMVIGSALILLVSDSYIKTTGSIKVLREIKYLDGQLNDVASLIIKEIKRAGFVNYNVDIGERYIAQYRYNLSSNNVNYKSPFIIEDGNKCIRFFYDVNKDGCIGGVLPNGTGCTLQLNGNAEVVGYKFEKKSIKSSWGSTDSCSSGSWLSMIDNDRVNIDDFSVKIKSVEPVMSGDQSTKLFFPVIELYIKGSIASDSSIKRSVTRTITLENPML